ncbi:predicted protein [Uncinocarpus reesii 1704]|uniref:Helicase-associated domain-containing protein n=1 Tax=Uncinocarpus reesii (strain UAMH 1704) TaxID=336963 RepID=C4JGU1_UNCRE|nr:uncharacterized protein UREG_02603 [Uncinocarpus reesii 1704]EEP77754.1 predicted protein [Uncinocarpus reesii 1704]
MLDVDDYPALAETRADPFRIQQLLESVVNAEFHTEFSARTSDRVSCLLTCSIQLLRTVIAVSEVGVSERDAKRAALLALRQELHRRNLLKAMFDHKARLTDLEEIYDYAAQFMCIPLFRIRVIDGAQRFEVTIELKEQSLSATAADDSLSGAARRAIHDFNKKRAIFVAINDWAKPNNNVTTLCDFKDFLAFYESLSPQRNAMRVKVNSSAIGENTSAYTASVYLHNERFAGPVIGFQEEQARNLALLTAGVKLSQQDPDAWTRYTGTRDKSPPTPLSTPPNIIKDLQGLRLRLQTALSNLEYWSRNKPDPPREMLAQQGSSNIPHLGSNGVPVPRPDHLANLKGMDCSSSSHDLPVYRHLETIVRMVAENPISIITGASGSGKSTQIPQILFDHAIRDGSGTKCNIFVVQDGIANVRATAQRVATDRAQPLGSIVGYSDTVDPKLPVLSGSITYHTSEVLLDLLVAESQDLFETVSHVIVDDLEQRSISTDLLLAYLKNKLAERQAEGKLVPKVILMGTNINVELFANYFRALSPGGSPAPCPCLHISIDSHLVQKYYLNDILEQLRSSYDTSELYRLLSEPQTSQFLSDESSQFKLYSPPDSRMTISGPRPHTKQWASSVSGKSAPPFPLGLVVATVNHIRETSNDGKILVLLPSSNEVERLKKLLDDSPLKNEANKHHWRVLTNPFTGSRTPLSFMAYSPTRRIILSASLEGSFAIPDVRFIVDTGLYPVKLYDPLKPSTSQINCWIDKASLQNRVEQTGRHESGKYYALFTKEREETFDPYSTPAIRRLDLERACLDAKTIFPSGGLITDILSQVLEPPAPDCIQRSIRKLQVTNILDDEETLTPLGRIITSIPLSPSAGKLIVLGIIFRCLEPALILAATIDLADEFGTIFNFQNPRTRRVSEPYKDFIKDSLSDHIGVINAFKDISESWAKFGADVARDMCRTKHIRHRMFLRVWESVLRLENMLLDAGIIPKPTRGTEMGGTALNINSAEQALIKALLTRALFPNVAVKRDCPDDLWRTATLEEVRRRPQMALSKHLESGSVAVFSALFSAQTGAVYLENATFIPPLLACLFTENLIQKNNLLHIESWAQYKLPMKHPVHVDGTPTSNFHKCKSALDKLIDLAVQDLATYKLKRTAWYPSSQIRHRTESRRGRKLTYLSPYIRTGVAKELAEYLGRLSTPSPLMRKGPIKDSSFIRWTPSESNSRQKTSSPAGTP